jgi:hypothetical protein
MEIRIMEERGDLSLKIIEGTVTSACAGMERLDTGKVELSTMVEVITGEEKITFGVRGVHRIDMGEIIKAECRGTIREHPHFLALNYSILNEEGEVLYSYNPEYK